jgi:hypothetical protein
MYIFGQNLRLGGVPSSAERICSVRLRDAIGKKHRIYREKASHILFCNNLSVVSLEINISLKPSWPALSSKSVAAGGIA